MASLAAENGATLSSERLARLREELADCDPDALAPEVPMGSPVSTASHQQLRDELRRLKFAQLNAEAQHRFIDGCLRHFEGCSQTGLDGQRRQQKEQNKSLKRTIKQQEDTHRQIAAEIAETYSKVRAEHERCMHGLAEASGSTGAGGVGPEGAFPEAAEAAMRRASEDMDRSAAETTLAWREHHTEVSSHLALEGQLKRLESRSRDDRAAAAAVRAEEARDRAHCDAERKLLDAEGRLGLPEISVDESRRTVVLSGRSGGQSEIAEEFRTVTVEMSPEDGRLTRAEPHQALGLQSEARAAVRDDDLPALLSIVWNRICEDRPRAHNGGA